MCPYNIVFLCSTCTLRASLHAAFAAASMTLVSANVHRYDSVALVDACCRQAPQRALAACARDWSCGYKLRITECCVQIVELMQEASSSFVAAAGRALRMIPSCEECCSAVACVQLLKRIQYGVKTLTSLYTYLENVLP